MFAVANSSLPAKDTVAVLNIHACLHYMPNDVLFSADTSVTWMQNLKNNVLPTGNLVLDNIMIKYYLRYQYIWNHGWVPDNVRLTSDTALNAMALRDNLSTSLGATYVDLNHMAGNPANITGTINPTYTDLTYSYGWGDCPSGCTSFRSWQFRVYNNCSVEYSGSYGDAITFVYTGLNKAEKYQGHIKIYPNPANNFFKIEHENAGTLTIHMLNTTGQLVYVAEHIATGQEIDIDNLQSGVYIVKAFNESGQQFFKIMKN